MSTLAVIGVLAGAGLATVPAASASAAGSTLLVDNSTAAHCADAVGSGTQAQPFCTIQAAAAAALPGDTVQVATGTYGPTHLTSSGSPDAPLVIAAAPGAYPAIVVPSRGAPGPALALDHVHDVQLRGFALGSYVAASTVTVAASGNVTLDRDRIVGMGFVTNTAPTLAVDGQTTGLVVSRSQLSAPKAGNVVQLAPGAQGTVLTTNVITSGAQPAVLATDAPDTAIVSNSIRPGVGCFTAIDLAGASTGAEVENNLVQEIPAACASGTGTPLVVSPGSVTGTTWQYNTVQAAAGVAPYLWAGQSYATPDAFRSATRQGEQDILQTVDTSTTPDQRRASVVDSADAAAPHELDTDLFGHARVDDPLVPNTGTGVGYDDRGATEYQDPVSLKPIVSIRKGPAPFDDTVTANVDNPWNTPITGYTYDFGDGSGPQASTDSSLTHRYTTPTPANHYDAVTVTATTAAGKIITGYGDGVTVDTDAPLVPHLDLSRGPNPLTVEANALATMDAWSIHSYAVDYGDGSGTAALGTPQVGLGEHTYPHPGTYTATLTVLDDGGRTATTSTQVTVGSAFTPMVATRILDTRHGLGAAKAQLGPHGSLRLKVAGVAGIPATGVTSVTLNVTALDMTAPTAISAAADNTGFGPSFLSVRPGPWAPHEVTVPVGADGCVRLGNLAGRTDLLAEVQGYTSTSAQVDGAGATGYVEALRPLRVLDTRTGLGAVRGKIAHNGSARLSLPQASLPASSLGYVSGVIVDVTAANGASGGQVTVSEGNGPTGDGATLTVTPGRTSTNQVVLPVDSSGAVELTDHAGSVDLAASIVGYVVRSSYWTPQTGTVWPGSGYFPTATTRVRTATVGANSHTVVKLAGTPAVPAGAKSVLVDLTATGATTGTWLSAWTDGTSWPGTSALSLPAHGTGSVQLLLPLGPDGSVIVYNAFGRTTFTLDVEGYFSG